MTAMKHSGLTFAVDGVSSQESTTSSTTFEDSNFYRTDGPTREDTLFAAILQSILARKVLPVVSCSHEEVVDAHVLSSDVF